MLHVFQILTHVLKSTRIDVLHSPYVYAMYQDVLSKNQSFDSTLSALTKWTKCEPFIMNTESNAHIHNPHALYPIRVNTPFDLAYVATQKPKYVVIEKPYLNKERRNLLHVLATNPHYHITVDVRKYAILIHRPEQARQYFRLIV